MEIGKDFIGVGGGAIIVNDKNEVLLILHSKNSRSAPSCWSRPGGAVEFGESIKHAIKREIMEEIGVEIKLIDFLQLNENIDKKNGFHWLAISYSAKIISGVPKVMEPNKHDAIKWFPIGSLPKNISNFTKSSIEIYLNAHAGTEPPKRI